MKDRITFSPAFPERPKGKGFFSAILGIFFWIFLLLFFAIGLYAAFFGQSLVNILRRISPRIYFVPFWFSLLMTIFFFPITLIVILISAFLNILFRETI